MEFNILQIAILFFVVMESANVIILYFFPNSKYGNGVCVFNGWDKSKEDKNTYLFVKYLVNWVAGVKLIFIVLLLVIMIIGSVQMQIAGVAVMILSIGSYWFGLHPIICKLDKAGEITPKGYSKVLGMMIAGFMVIFTIALILHLTLGI